MTFIFSCFFSIGRQLFLNQSTEDLLLDLFNTHFSSTGLLLKAYIDHYLSSYTFHVSPCSETYKMHHWREQVTNTASKLHHLNPSTKSWMSHWALMFPASLGNGFIFSTLDCLVHFLKCLFALHRKETSLLSYFILQRPVLIL